MFRISLGILSLVCLLFMGIIAIEANQTPERVAERVAQRAAQQAKQKEETSLKNQSALAFGTCVRAVENAAKYDLRWTSWGKFHSADGIVHPDGKVLFSGDQAEAQNGFGGWVRIRYFCVFDPRTKQAEVSIERGRFPR